MAIPVTFAGIQFEIPEYLNKNWAQDVTGFLVCVADNALPLTGGSFPISSDIDFGANYGLTMQYLTSRSTPAATSGMVRLARADVIAFRNEADSANLSLGVNSSNKLTFEGEALAINSDLSALAGRVTAAEGDIDDLENDVSILQGETAGLDYDLTLLEGRVTVNEGDIAILESDVSILQSGKQPIDGDLTAIAAINTTGLLKRTGANTWSTTSVRAEVGLTTKGDILVDTGSALARQPIGTDGRVLVADSSQATGMSWQNTPPASLPAGVILPYAGTSIPSGYLLCDGDDLAQADYPDLYAAIGNTYNTQVSPITGVAQSSPGAGRFRLPNLYGSFIRMAGPNVSGADSSLGDWKRDSTAKRGLSNASSSISGTAAGQTLGTTNVSLASGSAASAGAHTHNVTMPNRNVFADTGVSGYNMTASDTLTKTSTSAGAHTHTVTGTTNIGHTHAASALTGTAAAQTISSTDLETAPMALSLYFIIKV